MKADSYTGFSGTHLELIAAADQAAHAIPPMWPLEATVAVNPFLGQTEEPLAKVAARLARVAGIRVTQPREKILAALQAGEVLDEDIDAAIAAMGASGKVNRAEVRAAAGEAAPAPARLPCVADLAAEVSGTDWPALVADRIGTWAGSYFDAGQALWSTAPGQEAFDCWQTFAARDLAPEIAGLGSFTARVAALPQPARRTLSQACDLLGITPAAAGTYFHQLLLDLAGWGQLARKQLFDAELRGETDAIVTDLLTLRLVWEAALFEKHEARIADKWAEVRAAHEAPVEAEAHHLLDAVLQTAMELAFQRRLADTLEAAQPAPRGARPSVQAAFCIDVRSERFRRALEAQDPRIETFGFAGFFGVGAAHRDAASDVIEARLPVLLTPQIASESPDPQALDRRLGARAARAWGRFRQAAVSSFAFVEASGPLYAGKLLQGALHHAAKEGPSARPQLAAEIDRATRAQMAGTILRAMSLTQNFAPVVLLVGHGAHVTNNAHASALQCGACGGYAGDVSARLLAGLLNDRDVRADLVATGIDIPADTRFVAGLHDTTRDTVTLYETDLETPLAPDTSRQLQVWLQAAGRQTVAERGTRLSGVTRPEDVLRRALDWAEVRPEWGLAGCASFIAAPRHRTEAASLGGRAFLHTYDWRRDEGFGTLELILTAPVVVASWISLAYYGAVVAPQVFGGGNKLLHNVCGGVGTLEGNGGVLRAGLPWQSVHDGEGFQHEALRLSVVIEAPTEAINDILARHAGVKALFDNGWLHLIAMDDEGRLAQRYNGDLTWQTMRGSHPTVRAAQDPTAQDAA
jgi:uncharacterized protein YbcC (UPF0753/DUF2309 family)